MRFKFLPREFNFFDLFDKEVEIAVEAAVLLKELASAGIVDAASLTRMEGIEHKGDQATHDIIEHLNKTFITPFDREDIYKLATELDDVIDMMNTIVSRLRLYKLNGVNENLVEFASVIERSVREVARAVNGLRKPKDSRIITEACVEINRLENVGDSMRDEALADLFETESNPIAVIKWKEIYQDSETVLDVCEDVANVVESILVKQA
jgi:predicted phosphate transport protein (TIGR00153 family)